MFDFHSPLSEHHPPMLKVCRLGINLCAQGIPQAGLDSSATDLDFCHVFVCFESQNDSHKFCKKGLLMIAVKCQLKADLTEYLNNIIVNEGCTVK